MAGVLSLSGLYDAAGDTPSVEKALQNQYGSDLVDDCAVSSAGAAGGVQMAVSFGGGEALIPEVDRESECFAEGCGERLGFGGLGAHITGKVEGITEDDSGAVVFAEQAAEGFEILAEILADQGEHRLRGEAQLVGDSDADAACAEVKAEQARGHVLMVVRAWPSEGESPHLTISSGIKRKRFLDLLRRFFFLLVLAALAGTGAVAYVLLTPAGPQTPAFVVIAPGTSTSKIAVELKGQGLIRSQYVFVALALAQGRTLKAGEYRFDHPARMEEVWRKLERGDVYTLTVTIPEGSNIFDIGARLEAAGLGTKEAFLQAARQDTDLVADLDPKAPGLEGYLFPNTYRFSPQATPRQIAAAMVEQFRQSARSIGLTSDFHRVVTLASLVEKETPIEAERPLVASVFVNRLEKDMPLMTDPSVIYAALLQGRYRGAIYESDLESDSSYNTYQHAGLPPGPICNPSVQSLEAAMHPAQTDYLYFVAASADPSGASRFSATLEEHRKDVQAYRRAVRQAARSNQRGSGGGRP
jgi:UPF0755 protein